MEFSKKVPFTETFNLSQKSPEETILEEMRAVFGVDSKLVNHWGFYKVREDGVYYVVYVYSLPNDKIRNLSKDIKKFLKVNEGDIDKIETFK